MLTTPGALRSLYPISANPANHAAHLRLRSPRRVIAWLKSSQNSRSLSLVPTALRIVLKRPAHRSHAGGGRQSRNNRAELWQARRRRDGDVAAHPAEAQSTNPRQTPESVSDPNWLYCAASEFGGSPQTPQKLQAPTAHRCRSKRAKTRGGSALRAGAVALLRCSIKPTPGFTTISP